MADNQLTVGPKSGRGWRVSGRDLTFRTQALAIQAAKHALLARGGGELLIKARDGRVREHRTVQVHRPAAVDSAALRGPVRRPPEDHPAVLGHARTPTNDVVAVQSQDRRPAGHRRGWPVSLLVAVAVVILAVVATSRDGEVPIAEPSVFRPTASLAGSSSPDATPGLASSLSLRGVGSADELPVRLPAGRYRATATVSAIGAACHLSATIASVDGPPVSEELAESVTFPGATITSSEDKTLRAAPYAVRVSAPGCRWKLTIEPVSATPLPSSARRLDAPGSEGPRWRPGDGVWSAFQIPDAEGGIAMALRPMIGRRIRHPTRHADSTGDCRPRPTGRRRDCSG
jgi:hypothetical protein